MIRVHLLDVGDLAFADCVLVETDDKVLLIDGAHEGDDSHERAAPIPVQLEAILGPPPFVLDLLVVSHAHEDHIGCLPNLVRDKLIEPRVALVPDPAVAWGPSFPAVAGDSVAAQMAALLREEFAAGDLPDDPSPVIEAATTLRSRFEEMTQLLTQAGTHLLSPSEAAYEELQETFSDIGLHVYGPSEAILGETTAQLADAEMALSAAFMQASMAGETSVSLLSQTQGDAVLMAAASRLGAAVNLQSVVLRLEDAGRKALFGGDFQFVHPELSGEIVEAEVAAIRGAITADGPFRFVKVSHHGSDNSFDAAILAEVGGGVFGISTGRKSKSHPDPAVTAALAAAGVSWVRTDRNGRCIVELSENGEELTVAEGDLNDASPPGVPPG